MFLTPGSRATRKRVSAVAGSTVAGTLGPFTTNQVIYANSSNTVAGMSGTSWADATTALTITSASTANTVSLFAANSSAFQIGTTVNNAPITFMTNAIERGRVEAFGMIIAPNGGGSSMINTFDGGFTSPNLQAADVGFQTGIGIARYSNSAAAGKIHFGKSRGTVVSSNVIVQSSDDIGLILFEGSDGFNFQEAAYIKGVVDAAPSSAGNMPGRLGFYTSPIGTTVPTERFRISNNGQLTNGVPPIAGQLFNGGVNGDFQIMDVSGEAAVAVMRYSNGVTSGRLHFAKSRGATVGTNTIVQVGDELGEISYEGANGATFSPAASVQGLVDAGTPSSTSMPGRVCIFTVPNGSLGLVERMRIDNSGNAWLMSAPSTPTTPTGARGNVNETVACYNHQVYGGL